MVGFLICSAGCEQSISEAQESVYKPQYDDAMDAKHYCAAARIASELVSLNYNSVDPHDTYFHLWLAGRRVHKWEDRQKDAAEQCQQQTEGQH